jgi:hypothetical protein
MPYRQPGHPPVNDSRSRSMNNRCQQRVITYAACRPLQKIRQIQASRFDRAVHTTARGAKYENHR